MKNISKKIWLRALFLGLSLMMIAAIYLVEWTGADLFQVTWAGRTFMEVQADWIAKVTIYGYVGLYALCGILGMEALYQTYIYGEKEAIKN